MAVKLTAHLSVVAGSLRTPAAFYYRHIVTNVSIRQADDRDAAAIASVLVESWRAAYSGIIADEHLTALSIEAQEQRWRKRLESRQSLITLVACDNDGSIIGFVAGGRIRHAHDDFDGELYAIYLAPAVQRRGLGRRLLIAWAERAMANGFRSALVRVFSANPANAFYERLGARFLREGAIDLDGVVYPETWYGWSDLHTLRG